MESIVKVYPKKPVQIYWFAGCTTSLVDAQSSEDAKTLFKRLSLQIITPHMKCCGRSFFNLGHTSQSILLAQYALKAFKDDVPVVTLSAECVTFFRVHLPELLRDTDDYAAAKALAARTFYWSNFMWHVCKPRWTDKGNQTTVMVHTSCEEFMHEDTESSANCLLQSLEKVTVESLPAIGRCCGANLMLRNHVPESAATLTHRTIEPILAKNPDVLVGNESLCTKYLAQQLRHQGSKTTVSSLPTFLRSRVV